MFNTRIRTTSRAFNLSGLRKQPTFRDVTLCFPKNWRLWERTQKFRAYDVSLLRFGQCCWLVLPRGKFTSANRGEALPKPGQWHVTSLEFLRSFLSRHFLVKPAQWCREISFFFSGYKLSKLLQFGQNACELERFMVTFTAKGQEKMWDAGWEFSKCRK